jgi:2-polyprenyl-6-methoxyphenol hydroxylase-like FAD-dependent oxidoreductase
VSNGKRILISGAGIAGPALAWWLDHFGFEPSIVELAPEFRSGGYMVDFWGKGFDIVEQMGLREEVERTGYHVREVCFVGKEGDRAGSFSTEPFWSATGGRFTSIPRGDLAQIVWGSLGGRVRARFGDEIESLDDRGDKVEVMFASGDSDSFDMVIGADGLHSRVRELLFGPEARFERFLGFAFAAFTVEGYEPRTPNVYMMYGVPGRQAARFAMRGGRTLVLFIWRAGSPALPHSDSDTRALLRRTYVGAGWECPQMLEDLNRSDDLYVDAVSQIRLEPWSKGRCALVGDAAWAPSFLAGEGSGLGIIGAYALAGELALANGDPRAFASYHQRLGEFMRSKQDMATKLGGAFVPATAFGLWFRNHVASLLNLKPLAGLALGAGLRDDIDLPDYEAEISSGRG